MHKEIKRIIAIAFFIAIGLVLPFCFHMVPSGGNIFLPMHLPVILGGALLGIIPGIAIGMLTPILSFLMTSMPSAVVLPGMTLELITYGFMMGLLVKLIKTRWVTLNIYIALIISMLAGRIVSGLTNAFIFQAGSYHFKTWLNLSFVMALPGILLQLIIIPSLYLLLKQQILKKYDL